MTSEIVSLAIFIYICFGINDLLDQNFSTMYTNPVIFPTTASCNFKVISGSGGFSDIETTCVLNHSLAYSNLFFLLFGIFLSNFVLSTIFLALNISIACSTVLKLKYLYLASSFQYKHFKEELSYGDFLILILIVKFNSLDVVKVLSLLLFDVVSRRNELDNEIRD